jgi:hypothetical protein
MIDRMFWRMFWTICAFLGRIDRVFESWRWPNRGRRHVEGHTLYHFQVSPYSRKARHALAELSLDVPMKDVLLDEAAWQDLVKLGGRDMVPCLRISGPKGDRWLYESEDIVRYLHQEFGRKTA